MNRSAGNSRCFGCCRMIRCSTIGTAIASAPPRNARCRKPMKSGIHRSKPCAAAGQVSGQGPIELHAGVECHVVDAASENIRADRCRKTPGLRPDSRPRSRWHRSAASRASRAPRTRSCRRTETAPRPRPARETGSRRARRAATGAARCITGSGSANKSVNSITRLRCRSMAAICIRLLAMSVVPAGRRFGQQRQHVAQLRALRTRRQAVGGSFRRT